MEQKCLLVPLWVSFSRNELIFHWHRDGIIILDGTVSFTVYKWNGQQKEKGGPKYPSTVGDRGDVSPSRYTDSESSGYTLFHYTLCNSGPVTLESTLEGMSEGSRRSVGFSNSPPKMSGSRISTTFLRTKSGLTWTRFHGDWRLGTTWSYNLLWHNSMTLKFQQTVSSIGINEMDYLDTRH